MNSGFVKAAISIFYLSLLMAYVTLAQETATTLGSTPKTDPANATASGNKTGTESPGTSAGTPKSTLLTTLTTNAKNESTATTTAKLPTTAKSAGICITGTEAALAMLVCVVYAAL